MKIGVVSDLHLEFGDLDLPNHDNIDVLVLSGDICVAEDLYRHPADANLVPSAIAQDPRRQTAVRYREFIKKCADRFPHVIYIMGNHEHYHGVWERTATVIEDLVSPYGNVYFLEQANRVIDGVEFIGATLWTDCNRHDPVTMYSLKGAMNDYRVILRSHNGYNRLRPEDTLRCHQRSLAYVQQCLSQPQGHPTVVCTHHAPSRASTHPRYRDDTLMNGGYSSELSDLILDNPQIALWTHGHTHEPFDYMIGPTRVVCNPRGYVGHERDPNDTYLAHVVEI